MPERLWIGILPAGATDQDLTQFLAAHEVHARNTRVVRDRTTGESRRIGSAEVDDPDYAIAALDGRMLGAYRLKVARWRS